MGLERDGGSTQNESVPEAVDAYTKAEDYALTGTERVKLIRKKADAYLRIYKLPPSSLISPLAKEWKKILNGNSSLDEDEKVHIGNSLAWHYRTKGGVGNVKRAKGYLKEAIMIAEQGKLDHEQMVTRQYYAETLMRNCEFDEVETNSDPKNFTELHFARRAYSRHLLARAKAYRGWLANDVTLLEEAVNEFNTAEEDYSVMGTSARRANNLIELAKFYSVVASVIAMNGDHDKKVTEYIGQASKKLALAGRILSSLRTFARHTGTAKEINSHILALVRVTKPGVQISSPEISSEIEALKDLIKATELSGHKARIYSLLAAWQILINGEAIQARGFARDARTEAIKRDFLTIFDCYKLISLGSRKATDNRINLSGQSLIEVFCNQLPRKVLQYLD